MTIEEAINYFKSIIFPSTNDEKILRAMKANDMAIEALQKQPRWIPVTERLPEAPEYDWVLVATQISPAITEGWYGVPHVAELRNGKWCDQYYDGEFEKSCGVEVTHWMPMLDNPKKGDEE